MKTKETLSFTLLLISLMMFSACGYSQKNTKEIKIMTSAQCGICKDRIEGAFAYENGVKKSTLDLTTKVLTVVYNPAKIDETKIRLIINNLGYDADDTKANPVEYAKLPACCKKPDDSQKK
ncbi:MAG: cation transporter [Bacteroidota bacterium]